MYLEHEVSQKLTIVNQNNEQIEVDFSDIASASSVTAELAKKLNIGASADASTVQSYYGLKKYTDEAKSSAISSANSYTDEKIGEIPAAIVYKGDGTTITQSGTGTVTFSVGNIEQGKVTGLTAALASKADAVHSHEIDDVTGLQNALNGKANTVHTHAIADLTDLNEGWDALLKAAPDVATDTDLTALEGRVDTAEGDIDTLQSGKADKTEALKDVTATAAADASKVTVTLSKTPVSGAAKTSTVDVPAAQADAAGVITENRVKALAGEVAGSVYKVKGTKANIGEVLAVGTAAVGDVYAGTNVVFVGPAEEGEPDPSQQAQWDALGGTVDLTPYETTAHAAATYATKTSVTELSGKVDANTAAIATKADTTTVEEIDGRLTTAKGEIDALQTGKLDTSTFTAHVADRTKMHLPEVTSADDGKVLGVVGDTVSWATMSIPLAEGTTTAGIVKAADDSVTISAGTIKVEAMTTTEIEGICI